MRWRKKHKIAHLRAAVRQMGTLFCIIVTILLFTNMFLNESMQRIDMFRIILSAFVGVIPMLLSVFFDLRWPGTILHFFITGGLVIAVQLFFTDGGRDVFFLSTLIFLFIYALTNLRAYLTQRHLTQQVNKKLDALHHQENATHPTKNATNKD